MFSALLLLTVAIGFGLSIFLILLLFVNQKKYSISYKESSVVIVKIVELHRENLPLSSAHGWNLAPSSCSLRCWQKELPISLTEEPISVYACAKEISCAAVIILNVIADVSTWPEWDVQVRDQIVHLELPENPSLHGDRYMQCDQVLTSSRLRLKPEVEMFRFGNLESNGTGWILLWNAKRLDWVLYVAQPIEDCSDSGDDNSTSQSEERCLLTAIWGCDPNSQPELQHRQKDGCCHPHSMPDALCRKVLSLSDAICWSRSKVRPFRSLLHPDTALRPHFPTVHSALVDLPRRPCVLLDKDKDRAALPLPNGALAVVPMSRRLPLTAGSITGFSLTLCQVRRQASGGGGAGSEKTPAEEKRRSRRRLKNRSDSVSSPGLPRMKHLEIESKRSSSLTTPLRKKPPELTVTVADDDSQPQPPQRSASHSFLHTLFQRRRSSTGLSDHSRSPSPLKKCRRGGPPRLERTSSLSSQEDISSRSSFQDLDLSDTEGREFLSMAHDMQNESTDFKALGEYSISAVLQENLKASLVNVNMNEADQKRVSGGWAFKDVNKNIAVFKKTTCFDSCVFVSYLSRGVIPTTLSVVWKTLCNPRTRFMYDDTVKKLSVLHEYPTGQKLIHMHNECVTLLHKEMQDFSILQTEKVEGTRHILGFHSVKVANCPLHKDIARGTVVASGWVVEPNPDENDSCQVSYLIQMVVSSPDASSIEEISHMQLQCIHNLSLYLSSKPPTHIANQ